MTAAQAADAECEQDFINKALARISNHQGVFGLLVVHPAHNRVLHKSGFGGSTEICEKWVRSLIAFVGVAASTVRTLDHTDDLTFLRMQWRTKHIIVCPDPSREYCIIVVQDQMKVHAPESGDGIMEATLAAASETWQGGNSTIAGAASTMPGAAATTNTNASAAAASS